MELTLRFPETGSPVLRGPSRMYGLAMPAQEAGRRPLLLSASQPRQARISLGSAEPQLTE